MKKTCKSTRSPCLDLSTFYTLHLFKLGWAGGKRNELFDDANCFEMYFGTIMCFGVCVNKDND